MLQGPLIVLLVLALGAPAFSAEPEADSGTINIMRPEPKAPADKQLHKAKKKARKARRGSSNPVYPIPLPGPQAPLPLPHRQAVTPAPTTPPPLFVPQTGRTLPNLPATGAGPGGTETLQDRSVRCAHQAGVYGPNATGNPSSYIGSCINQ
jgi:hypothetical protein